MKGGQQPPSPSVEISTNEKRGRASPPVGARQAQNESLLLQAFIGTMAMMTPPLAGVVAEDRRRAKALARGAAIVRAPCDPSYLPEMLDLEKSSAEGDGEGSPKDRQEA